MELNLDQRITLHLQNNYQIIYKENLFWVIVLDGDYRLIIMVVEQTDEIIFDLEINDVRNRQCILNYSSQNVLNLIDRQFGMIYDKVQGAYGELIVSIFW